MREIDWIIYIIGEGCLNMIGSRTCITIRTNSQTHRAIKRCMIRITDSINCIISKHDKEVSRLTSKHITWMDNWLSNNDKEYDLYNYNH